MKRLMTLVLVLGMTVLAPLSALGAIHDSAGDFANWYWPNIIGGEYFPLNFNNIVVDHWFKVEKDYAYWKTVGNFGSLNFYGEGNDGEFHDDNIVQLAGEYYCNDQTFAEIGLTFEEGVLASIKGTYLAQSNFFFGMNYGANDSNSLSLISSGYKFKFNESNYLAFSLDYAMFDPDPYDMGNSVYATTALDVDFKYFTSTGKTKLLGQAYIFNDDYFGDATQLDFALNHKINNQWVIGGFVGVYNEYYLLFSDTIHDTTLYGAGFTFAPTDWVFDAKFTVIDEDTEDEVAITELSGMHAMNNQLRIGAGVNMYSDLDDPELFAKFVWLVGGGNFDFAWRMPNDSFGSLLFLGYKKAL